ncbi:hypothetical protein DY000_02023737 [Brassica cretica]|uniref:Uncharacterized protein n=1 Tax=Brassica cretica TaxID=69181 RepID=A0ABQ7EEZ9_BRACR|nr:hypothetical protein DY000_02023737 [Brassica cretica]
MRLFILLLTLELIGLELKPAIILLALHLPATSYLTIRSSPSRVGLIQSHQDRLASGEGAYREVQQIVLITAKNPNLKQGKPGPDLKLNKLGL